MFVLFSNVILSFSVFVFESVDLSMFPLCVYVYVVQFWHVLVMWHQQGSVIAWDNSSKRVFHKKCLGWHWFKYVHVD